MGNGRMLAVLDYIERHLDAEISMDELADMAGYSPFHFARLFARTTGEPLSGYILRRRLKRAITQIGERRKAIDVVLALGFETYAGFYKAFVRTYGCSPSTFLKIYAAGIPASERWGESKVPRSKEEVHAILRNWDEARGAKLRMVPIFAGKRESETAYYVGEGYMLRMYTNRTCAMRVLALADALHTQGFNAATPVPARDGRRFVESNLGDGRPGDGGAVAALVRRVPGEPLSMEERYGERSREYAEETGRAIARLHAALRDVEDAANCDESDLYKTCANWALPIVRKQDEQWSLGLGEGFFQNYLDEFGERARKLPRQPIHRDPHPGNILFEHGKVSGFIDFDLFERNARLFDPCYAATGILSESGDDPRRYQEWIGILGGILRGYDQIEPLTPDEKRAVYHVLCSIQMIFCAYCEGFDDAMMKELAKTNRRMLVFVADHRADIEGAAPSL